MEVLKATDANGNPTLIDRVGAGSGNYFSPMKPNGEPYSVIERGIGDYLPEKNIADNDSYHLYEMKKDFSRENFEKAINDTYSDPAVRKIKQKKLENYYEDAIRDTNTFGHDGEKYSNCTIDKVDGVKSGEIDQMFLKEGDGYCKGTDGGGEQLISPFSADELVEMGMIVEL